MHQHHLHMHKLLNYNFISCLCVERALQTAEADVQRQKEQLDQTIDNLSQRCAKTPKDSADVMHPPRNYYAKRLKDKEYRLRSE